MVDNEGLGRKKSKGRSRQLSKIARHRQWEMERIQREVVPGDA